MLGLAFVIVAIDSTSGGVFVSGYVSGSLHGQAHQGGTDVVLLKFDASGSRLWTQLFGTSGNDQSNEGTC